MSIEIENRIKQKKNVNLVTSFPYPHVDVISFDSDGGANMFGLILLPKLSDRLWLMTK